MLYNKVKIGFVEIYHQNRKGDSQAQGTIKTMEDPWVYWCSCKPNLLLLCPWAGCCSWSWLLNWSSDQVWSCTKNCWVRPFSLSIIACYRCKNIQSYGKLWGHVNIWSNLILADYVAIYSLRLPCICLWAVVSFCHKTSPNSTVLLVQSLVNSHTQFQWSNISEVRWVGTKEHTCDKNS